MRTWLAVSVTLLFWSSAFAGIRAGLAGYTPGHLVLLRFLSASGVFILYAIIRGIRPLALADIPKVALLGFTGITVYHTALTFGEVTVQAGTASLLIAAAPAFTALISFVALKERLTLWGWSGLAIGFAGVAVITFGSGHSQGITQGALLILLSAVCTAFFFVYQKPLYKRYRPIDLTAYVTFFGTLPMLVFAPGLLHQIRQAPLPATLSAVYIGVFPAAVAYVAWAIALQGAKATSVSSALYVNPVLAIFIAWIWLREVPGMITLVGGLLAIVGVLVVNLWGTGPTSARTQIQAAVTSDSSAKG